MRCSGAAYLQRSLANTHSCNYLIARSSIFRQAEVDSVETCFLLFILLIFTCSTLTTMYSKKECSKRGKKSVNRDCKEVGFCSVEEKITRITFTGMHVCTHMSMHTHAPIGVKSKGKVSCFLGITVCHHWTSAFLGLPHYSCVLHNSILSIAYFSCRNIFNRKFTFVFSQIIRGHAYIPA